MNTLNRTTAGARLAKALKLLHTNTQATNE